MSGKATPLSNLQKHLASLEHPHFEARVYPGGTELFSIGTTSSGQRVRILCEENRDASVDDLWFDKVILVDESRTSDVTNWHEFHHVKVTGFVENQHGKITVKSDVVPVQASNYPTENCDVTLLENSLGEQWAIGEINGETYTFFYKPVRFGAYWVASRVNNTATVSERIQAKTSKGYKIISKSLSWDAERRCVDKI